MAVVPSEAVVEVVILLWAEEVVAEARWEVAVVVATRLNIDWPNFPCLHKTVFKLHWV